jgi:hypothetical protein
MESSHDLKPERVCSQRYDQVICVFCVYNNLLQTKAYNYVCEFLDLVDLISKKEKINLPRPFFDKHGIIPQVLNILFGDFAGYELVKRKNKKNIQRGWAVFQVSYKGQSFLHAVAIVNNYLIDSIELPYQTGVYLWDGTLHGYDSQKKIELWEIVNFIK